LPGVLLARRLFYSITFGVGSVTLRTEYCRRFLIVMIFLAQFWRQFLKWNFDNPIGRDDHQAIRFSATDGNAFIFLSVDRFEVFAARYSSSRNQRAQQATLH
jgi:hypothetical protein